MRAYIPWDKLPSTFQDAITVTRRLGIAYIWIDSLCIVQDDAQDWEREAAKMALIFESAYLTIAATAAPNGTVCVPLKNFFLSTLLCPRLRGAVSLPTFYSHCIGGCKASEDIRSFRYSLIERC